MNYFTANQNSSKAEENDNRPSTVYVRGIQDHSRDEMGPPSVTCLVARESRNWYDKGRRSAILLYTANDKV